MSQGRIGVLGGSGLYEIEGFENRKEHELETPFGDPSDPYRDLGDDRRYRDRGFLGPPRARPSDESPSELNFRANIFGFKLLGVDFLVCHLRVSAVCAR